MSKKSLQDSEFVKQVRERTNKYLQALADENNALRANVEVLECDKTLMQGRISELEDTLQREREEHRAHIERLDVMEHLRASAAQEYAIVEEQNNCLASLYTATYSLHGTLELPELLCVIKEIVANLIGSEEMAIYECTGAGKPLSLIGSMGLDPDEWDGISSDTGMIGHSISTGSPLIVERSEGIEASPREEHLTACVPLRVANETIGVIAIFRLLSQKQGLVDLDFELFDLLASQAAIAMYTVRFHQSNEADSAT